MKNGIDDLRNHLFSMIEDLRDPDTTVDLDRCKLVVAASESIIHSAKVEVSLLEATGATTDSALFKKKPALPNGQRTPAIEEK